MKVPLDGGRRLRGRFSHKETFVLFCFIFLSLVAVTFGSGHSSEGTLPSPTDPNNNTCIFCDSLVNPNCTEDETVTEKMHQQCKGRKTWCFKAVGRIRTYNTEGEKVLKEKVDRGCAKPYFEQACVHIQQEDQTDFKICYCSNLTCNHNLTVADHKVILNQFGHSSSDSIWKLEVWLISLCSLAYWTSFRN